MSVMALAVIRKMPAAIVFPASVLHFKSKKRKKGLRVFFKIVLVSDFLDLFTGVLVVVIVSTLVFPFLVIMEHSVVLLRGRLLRNLHGLASQRPAV